MTNRTSLTSTGHVVTAIFPDRETAVATRDLLGLEHYDFRWLAIAKPADKLEHRDEEVLPELHTLAECSDGPLGSIGRMLSGAGGSFRRALQAHGVAAPDAQAIDVATPPHGAVLVVHATAERTGDAAQIIEEGGGHVYSGSMMVDFVTEAPAAESATSEIAVAGIAAPVTTPIQSESDELFLRAPSEETERDISRTALTESF